MSPSHEWDDRPATRRDLAYTNRRIDELARQIEKLDAELVSKLEFSPVRNVVYALLGLIGTGLAAAMFSGMRVTWGP